MHPPNKRAQNLLAGLNSLTIVKFSSLCLQQTTSSWGAEHVLSLSGAVAVMALERVPADIRKNGGVARMSDPHVITEIKEAVTIPVMAKSRIGHFVESQILEALGIDYIDESEVQYQPGVFCSICSM